MNRQKFIWEFDDLVDTGLFTPEVLQYIRNVIDDVMKTKIAEKICGDHPFEILIFPNGNLILTRKDRDMIIERRH
jgi:hypothetical protein